MHQPTDQQRHRARVLARRLETTRTAEADIAAALAVEAAGAPEHALYLTADRLHAARAAFRTMPYGGVLLTGQGPMLNRSLPENGEQLVAMLEGMRERLIDVAAADHARAIELHDARAELEQLRKEKSRAHHPAGRGVLRRALPDVGPTASR